MLCKHEVVGSIPSSSTIQVTEVGEQATVEPSLASLSVARQRSMVCSREESAVLRAVSFFNNLEGKGAVSLMRARCTRVEMYLYVQITETKGRGLDGANTTVTVCPRKRIHGYGVKRLSACGGCLGDYRR